MIINAVLLRSVVDIGGFVRSPLLHVPGAGDTLMPLFLVKVQEWCCNPVHLLLQSSPFAPAFVQFSTHNPQLFASVAIFIASAE
jgi:hypothetical protein